MAGEEIDPQEVIANLSLDVIRGQIEKLDAKLDVVIGHLEAIESTQANLGAGSAEEFPSRKDADQ